MFMNQSTPHHSVSAGWVGELHRWLTSRDTALYFYSVRALANLDMDYATDLCFPAVFEEGVYPGYPGLRNR